MTWAQLDLMLPDPPEPVAPVAKPRAPKGRVTGAAIFARPA